MISEPFKTDDGRWWINGAQGPINYDSEAEAYRAYNLLKRFEERVDRPSILPPTDLFKPGTPPVRSVREDQIPAIPPLSDDEQIDGYKKLTEVEAARIEYEQAKSGKLPLRFQLKGMLAGGVGGFLLGLGMTLFRGC